MAEVRVGDLDESCYLPVMDEVRVGDLDDSCFLPVMKAGWVILMTAAFYP